jgi:formylglycine-generating enzyme required for sulfatase activity
MLPTSDEGQPPPQPWEQAGTQVGQEITGPDGGQMVWVPAGEFMMGTAGGGHNVANAGPVHKVRITKGFWLGKVEVTTAHWQLYLDEAGVGDWSDSDHPTPGDAYPAWFISWEDATAYCRYYGLNLPTEAQWEYAAAGPESLKFPWGKDYDPKKCGNPENPGPTGFTWPVGSFPEGASWCGALDMEGNVWEWCQDWFDDKYYANSPVDDPPGPATGTWRVLRGGSWDVGHRGEFRGVYRNAYDPTLRIIIHGFRCAKTP